jgi:uncharacterized protein
MRLAFLRKNSKIRRPVGKVGLMPPLSIGYVSLVGFVVMAPISSLVAGYGAKLAHALPHRRLEILFGLYLATMSARFVVSLV